MGKNDRRNYRLLTIANAISAASGGFSIPFFLVFFFEFGYSAFATSIAIQGIFTAVAAYYAGKASDRIGRKPLLVFSSIAAGLLVLLYVFIQELWHLYVLQALIGLITAIFGVAEQTFLADITRKVSRGADIGRYVMIIGVLSAVFTIIGGFFVGVIPFRIAFLLLGAIFILDTIPLFFLTEEPMTRKNKHV
ncbi:MFS transporter [Candidatus Woesearchaeota archaeon]|nr:MFS transporter [Candidatus Woesearchaeota archaeon]